MSDKITNRIINNNHENQFMNDAYEKLMSCLT
jgi:hypothetical protein